jgi:hypothetical protein
LNDHVLEQHRVDLGRVDRDIDAPQKFLAQAVEPGRAIEIGRAQLARKAWKASSTRGRSGWISPTVLASLTSSAARNLSRRWRSWFGSPARLITISRTSMKATGLAFAASAASLLGRAQ